MILGMGVDIVQNERMAVGLAPRTLTPAELEIMGTRRDKLSFLAGRWAAKEAAKKACPWISGWDQVEILNGPTGEPLITVQGLPNGETLHVSISHEREYAVGVVIRESVG